MNRLSRTSSPATIHRAGRANLSKTGRRPSSRYARSQANADTRRPVPSHSSRRPQENGHVQQQKIPCRHPGAINPRASLWRRECMDGHELWLGAHSVLFFCETPCPSSPWTHSFCIRSGRGAVPLVIPSDQQQHQPTNNCPNGTTRNKRAAGALLNSGQTHYVHTKACRLGGAGSSSQGEGGSKKTHQVKPTASQSQSSDLIPRPTGCPAAFLF